MHLKAQIRSLKAQIGRRPWVFARLAELEALEGRTRLALKRLRHGVRLYPAYASGHQVLGEMLLSLGQVEEARRELLLASSCCDSGHASFELLVDSLEGAADDASRGLLEEAWSRDRLNARLRDRMKKAGLINEPEFREILVPTEGERRARDEEIAALIRRLIAVVENPEVPVAPAPEGPGDTAHVPPPATPVPPVGVTSATAPEVLEPLAGLPTTGPITQSGDGPAVVSMPTPPPAPLAPPVSIPVPDLPDHAALFMTRSPGGTPQPIRSRALARVYEEQGYLELALGVVKDLQAAAPAGSNTAELDTWATNLEQRIAERTA